MDPSKIDPKEVFFLIAKFLSQSPLTRSAETLVQELEEKQLIPNRVNWLGEQVQQSYQQFDTSVRIQPNHLEQLLSQLVSTINTSQGSKVGIRKSLFSITPSAATVNPVSKPPTLDQLIARRTCHPTLQKWGNGLPINPVHAVFAREHAGCKMGIERIHQKFYAEKVKLANRSLGHLSAAYCVLFDMTGRYIFTGADDKLVKVWSALNGRLIATLRGALAEISDMAINHENTLLAVASNDKIIRIWSLADCSSVAVLSAHSGQITSVFFCPLPPTMTQGDAKYLASTASDGSVAFWAYTELPGENPVFQSKPTIYHERMRPGNAAILCMSFSPGGVFLAAGSADNNVRVYYMLNPEGVQRILEVEYHKDKVDSIAWANKGLSFVSGSKDGTAMIFRYEYQNWRYHRIRCTTSLPGEPPVPIDDPRKLPRVTMVGWTRDDSYVLTAATDFLVKMWDSVTGKLARVLKGHTDEVYIIESHPFHPNYMCTAGHDGRIAVWDVSSKPAETEDHQAVKVFEHMNTIVGAGHGAIFDCKFSPDGFGLAATDSHGHILIFALDKGPHSKFAGLPNDLFFHTDYRAVILPSGPDVIDEQTQLPTHLMPAPFLVDVDGNPYPPNMQRLVPGRENCHEEQLVPVVAVYPGGRREVVQGANNGRSNLDHMIEELAARNQVEGEVVVPGAPQAPPEAQPDADGGYRLGSAFEQVRPVIVRPGTGNASVPGPADLNLSRVTPTIQVSSVKPKYIVKPLEEGVLRSSVENRIAEAEEEEKYYQTQKQKPPPPEMGIQEHPLAQLISSPASRYGRIRRPVQAQQYIEPRDLLPSFERNDRDEGVVRPTNPPQAEVTRNQSPPRLPGPRVSNNSAFNRNRPRGSRVRYDVRRILEIHGVDRVEDLPDQEDSGSEHFSDSTNESSSSESEESDDDWGGSGSRRPTNREASTNGESSSNRPSRKRSRRLRSSSDEDNDDNEESRPAPKPAKRKRGPSNDMSNGDEPRPGPSTETATKEKPKGNRKKRVVAESGGYEEIPVEFRPTNWLVETEPKRTPYFPQIGDELVYLWQGHKLYIDTVKEKKLYHLTPRDMKNLPYTQHELPTEVRGRLVKVEFEIGPPRRVVLKLELTRGKRSTLPSSLLIKYHDAESVPDFLILRQIYDKSLRVNWNTGDRFRSLIDTSWWVGTIMDVSPCDRNLPDSKFNRYVIRWEAETSEDRLSAWDMEVIPMDFVIPPPEEMAEGSGIPASPEDLKTGLYEPQNEDWTDGHQDAECARISNLLGYVMELRISESFLTPVDLNTYPNYAIQIAYLVDLSMIKARLDNLFYRRSRAIRTDIEYIAINAEEFNEPSSVIVTYAKVLKDVLMDVLNNEIRDGEEVNSRARTYQEFYKQDFQKKKKLRAKSEETSDSEAEDNEDEISLADEQEGAAQSSRSLRHREPKKRSGNRKFLPTDENPYVSTDWRENCKLLVDRLWKNKDALPFRNPVSEVEYPDYRRCIYRPMALSNVKEELLGDNYESIDQFNEDMKMIFQNAKQYNTDAKSQIRTMTARLNAHYDGQFKLVMDRLKMTKSRQSSRPSKFKKADAVPGSSRSSYSTRASGSASASRQTFNSGGSESGTPRKYPQRAAAQNNPFIHTRSHTSETLSPPMRETATPASLPQTRTRRSVGSSNGSSSDLPGPSSVAKSTRRRVRFSSGGSSASSAAVSVKNGVSPASSTRNSLTTSSPEENGTNGRYSLRKKVPAVREESSSPESRRLPRKAKKGTIIESDSEFEIDEDHEAEKENNPLEGIDEELEQEEEEMEEDEDDEDDDSEFEGEDAKPPKRTSRSVAPRRSSRVVTKKTDDPDEDDDGDEEFIMTVSKSGQSGRATRNRGKRDKSYVQDFSDESE